MEQDQEYTADVCPTTCTTSVHVRLESCLSVGVKPFLSLVTICVEVDVELNDDESAIFGLNDVDQHQLKRSNDLCQIWFSFS